MPPQMEDVPVQIILSDKGARNTEELRIWFNGASMTITYDSSFKPKNISLIPFWNVTPFENSDRQWVKQEAQEALKSTIEQMVHILHYNQGKMLDRYFFLKGILLIEQGFQDQALEVFNTSITKSYWKNLLKTDSDSRVVFEEDSQKIHSSMIDGLFQISAQE
jgi:hypothetical protein